MQEFLDRIRAAAAECVTTDSNGTPLFNKKKLIQKLLEEDWFIILK